TVPRMKKTAGTLRHRFGFHIQHDLKGLLRFQRSDKFNVRALLQLLPLSCQAAPRAWTQARQHSFISAGQRKLVLYLGTAKSPELAPRAHNLSTGLGRGLHRDAYAMDARSLQQCLRRQM